jgi:selenocysteine-specific elongation factor
MKQIVLGTAGHIDHGKTSLIKALTGIETDRLKEEKERGITIELGFAHLELPGGKLIGIVDVPGHEKFIKNMVAGATGIDLVALVIAADEGVMPQTREHLDICELLKIKYGLVVLTKIDMVDSDWMELVREDVAEYLSGTFLAESPIVEVSSTTKEGFDDLIKVLDTLAEHIPKKETGHLFRIPVDRVFVMKGFGTVITGTAVSGQIRTGDEATIYPQNLNCRIRGIQVHNKDEQAVQAGLRTALNLQGIEKTTVRRGNVLATKDALRPTYMIDVSLDLLPGAPRKLKNRAKVRFHTGASEIISTVVLLDKDELNPGENCFAQIRLDEPTSVLRKDRYVLRSYSPVRTIGGGEVLNALPVWKKKRFSEDVISELKRLCFGEIDEVIEQNVFSGGIRGVSLNDLAFLVNISKKRLTEILKVMLAKKKVLQFDKEHGYLIHSKHLNSVRDQLLDTVLGFHKECPLKPGILKEELRSRVRGASNPKLFNFIMTMLSRENVVVLEKELVRLKDHRVTLKQDQKDVRWKLDEIYLQAGLEPPYFKDIKDKFPENIGNEVLHVMVREGILLKVRENMFFHCKAIEALKSRVVAFLEKHGEMTTPQFKELAGVSRKYAIPIVEYFDRLQVTVRVGDSRVLRKK